MVKSNCYKMLAITLCAATLVQSIQAHETKSSSFGTYATIATGVSLIFGTGYYLWGAKKRYDQRIKSYNAVQNINTINAKIPDFQSEKNLTAIKLQEYNKQNINSFTDFVAHDFKNSAVRNRIFDWGKKVNNWWNNDNTTTEDSAIKRLGEHPLPKLTSSQPLPSAPPEENHFLSCGCERINKSITIFCREHQK